VKNHLDNASAATLAATLILFVLALFLKGISHDLLLEAGVFLVSVKLVIGAHKNDLSEQAFMDRLDRIDLALSKLETRRTASENIHAPGPRDGDRSV